MKKFIIKSNQNFETVYRFYAFIISEKVENSNEIIEECKK
jgi:hypothetical protein